MKLPRGELQYNCNNTENIYCMTEADTDTYVTWEKRFLLNQHQIQLRCLNQESSTVPVPGGVSSVPLHLNCRPFCLPSSVAAQPALQLMFPHH